MIHRTANPLGWAWLAGLAWLLSFAPPAAGQEMDFPHARPVPRMQVLPLPHDQAQVTRDGHELTRYHFAPTLARPFLYPLLGPSGRSLTRMGHPRDPNSHSHHNSVWISHHDVNGVDFWSDRRLGRIVHRRVLAYDDFDDAAVIDVHNAWIDRDERVLLEEQRRMRFVPLAGGEWLLLLELELTPPREAVTLGKTPFGLVGVRLAKTIGVHDGGGRIRNSAGGVDEDEVFWKPARWVDYSGPIAPGAIEGVTLLDHPDNPRHPSVFHVRNDGWMGASLTHAAPLTIEPGAPLIVRYGLYVHAGAPSTAELDGVWRRYVDCARSRPAEP